MIVVALGLEQDGRRGVVRRAAWVANFTPEMRDRVAAVTTARPQTQLTTTTLRRTRLVCQSINQFMGYSIKNLYSDTQ